MSKIKLKIAVIGLGKIGKTVSINLVKGHRPVIIASRRFEDAELFAQELGKLATPLEVLDAIRMAEIIIMAVRFETIKELIDKYSKELFGKIIIDPSNPIAPGDQGGFVKVIGAKESAGEILSALLPQGTGFVKALGSLGSASLLKDSGKKPMPAVLFYATDNSNLNGEVEELIHDVGFDSLAIGKIDQSIRIEVFGDLHEFGALGKTVTLLEAVERLQINQ